MDDICGSPVESSGKYPCRRSAGHDGRCDPMLRLNDPVGQWKWKWNTTSNYGPDETE